VTARLDHADDLDERHAVPFTTATVEGMAETLRRLGAPPRVRLISADAGLDATIADLEAALEDVEYVGRGTLVICLPGTLAAYIDEAGTRRRLVLRRDAPPRE